MRIRVARDGFSLSAWASGAGGDAPVILLSNALGTGLGLWNEVVDWLGESHGVIRYDTRGHGESDTPEGPYSFDDLVDDALAVMDHYGAERADYLGLSLGGMTGLGLGLRAPERLRRMVVCAARADAPQPFVQSWHDRIAAIRLGGMEAVWPGALERWLTPDFIAANPDRVAELRADFLVTTVDGYAGCAAALKGLDYLRHLSGLAVPTLYVSGAEDLGAPPPAMEIMAAKTPEAGYVCLTGAAHMLNINAPDAFTDAVARFLKT